MNNEESGSISKQDIVSFMLAEYEALRVARNTIITVSENRSNFFLAAITAATLALTFIGQASSTRDSLMPAGIAVGVGLFLLGTLTFIRALEAHIANYIYVRGMNRIRRYFVEKSPAIRDYIMLPTSDNVPRFKSVGFAPHKSGFWVEQTALIAAINSLVLSVLVSLLARCGFACSTKVGVGVGILAFVAALSVHQSYRSVRLKQVEKETVVRFPASLNDRKEND
jgi:hypothetical protein